LRKQQLGIILLTTILCSSLHFSNTTTANDHFFTIVLKARDHQLHQSFALHLGWQLQQIGIAVDTFFLDFAAYVQEILSFRDYDIIHFSAPLSDRDPDMTNLFGENSSMNIINYDTSLDYNSSLGTGTNQWFLEAGKIITPPNSQERIQHYWDWEQYLMDKITPAVLGFGAYDYLAHWAGLQGYDYTKELLQSWGSLDWQTQHANKTSTTELIVQGFPRTTMNPLLQEGSWEEFYSSLMLDPLVWIDGDKSVWPHLATNWQHLNQTHVRVSLREGVRWQTDPQGLFTNEYFDARDVYFTFFCWKYLSEAKEDFEWLKNMVIIDEYTIDFFIDGNEFTAENDPYPEYLYYLSKGILPEFYLNQTQIIDGVTPDILHPSWAYYANESFGTGLFELESYEAGNETSFVLNNNCWLFNDSVVKDDLDLQNRFGDTWALTKLRVREFSDFIEAAQEFAWGQIDIFDVSSLEDNRTTFQQDPNIVVLEKISNEMSLFAFNLDDQRGYIGSTAPCPNNPSLTIGLAIRKAINYATNRGEINEFYYNNTYPIIDHPLTPNMGVWLNPDIIRYDFDLTKAKEFMAYAGFDVDKPTTNGFSAIRVGFVFGGILLISLIITRRKKRKKELINQN